MRLNLKILLWMVVILVVVGGGAILGVVRLQRSAGLRQTGLAAQTLASVIYRGLERSMIRNDPTEIQEMISQFRNEPMVRRVEILTPEGRIWASSEPSRLGLPYPDPQELEQLALGLGGAPVDGAPPAPPSRPGGDGPGAGTGSVAPVAVPPGASLFVQDQAAAHDLLVATPVENRPSCRSCHQNDPARLGTILVSLDTEPLHAQVRSGTLRMALLMAWAVLVALVALRELVARYVLRPISAMAEAVEQVTAGDYSARVDWRSRDELGVLARAFNQMTRRIQGYTTRLTGEIAELSRRLSGLSLFGRTLAEASEMDQALSEVVEESARLLQADGCGIYLVPSATSGAESSPGNGAATGAAHGPSILAMGASSGARRRPLTLARSFGADHRLPRTLPMPPGETPGKGPAGREPQPAMQPAQPAHPAPDGEPAQHLLVVPLAVKDRSLGALAVVREDTANPFTPEDRELLAALANPVAIALENIRLFNELREKEQLRGRLLSRVMTAQEDERRRIARELHDEVSQSLTALVMHTDLALAAVPEGAGPLRERLNGLRQLANSTLDEVHRIVYDLRPLSLDDLDLAAALRWYARTHLEAAGIQASVTAQGLGEEERLPAPVEVTAYRVAQEAMANVLRHAKARRVRVVLRLSGSPRPADSNAAGPSQGETEGQPEGQRSGRARTRAGRRTGGPTRGPSRRTLTVTVADDGRGFDVEAVSARKDRPPLGLIGMRERVELLGGRLTIDSRPGEGTRVRAVLPIPEG